MVQEHESNSGTWYPLYSVVHSERVAVICIFDGLIGVAGILVPRRSCDPELL